MSVLDGNQLLKKFIYDHELCIVALECGECLDAVDAGDCKFSVAGNIYRTGSIFLFLIHFCEISNVNSLQVRFDLKTFCRPGEVKSSEDGSLQINYCERLCGT